MLRSSRFIVLAAFLSMSGCLSAEVPVTPEVDQASRIKLAREHFEQHSKLPRLPSPPPMKPAEIQRRWGVILSRPDPGTSFESFIYGIERRKGKLLSERQVSKWDKMMEKHSKLKQRLHDERNTIRVQCLVTEWDLAKASDVKRQAQLRDEYDQWLDLHMDYVFEEELAHDRFRADAWWTLTDQQRKHIHDGDWDSYVNKSTGHKRLYSADKIVKRALGVAKDSEAFDSTASEQREAHRSIHLAYTQGSMRMRKLTFALDLATESMVIEEWRKNYKPALRTFFEAQRDDISSLARKHYDLQADEIGFKVEAAKAKIESKVHEKYIAHAPELVGLLYPAK